MGWQIPPQICIFLLNLIQCEDWLVVRQWSKDMCLSSSQLISVCEMFSVDTVWAVITVYKRDRIQRPASWRAGALGLGAARWLGAPRPAWCRTRTALPPVPCPRSEWPQAGDPAQDLAELLLRLFLSRQPRPRCPFLSAECGGPGGKAGVKGTTSKRRWCRLHV